MSSPVSRHRRRLLLAAASGAPLVACATRAPRLPLVEATAQVRAAEVSFADTMARRDLDAFAGHIAEDAVFINGGKPLRGKPAIVEYWSQYFRNPAPPFAWHPEIVEVGAGGTLGYTEGPVTAGQAVIARFYSTWQLQPTGGWLVVFDNGYSQCAP
jgi:ketosteroid isomerase-like protein